MNAGHERVKSIFDNNKKVMENYFFMTILQILNSLFYLFLYPYLIRTLGAENYGLYVFAFSIVTYFITIINFGFDLPAVKSIAENADNRFGKEKTLSNVFTAKVYLGIISSMLFILIVLFIPSFRNNWLIYFICFGQSITNIIFPQWFFQGIQRMRTVTFIQLIFKLISLIFIFLYVKQDDDIVIFTFIMTITSISGALIAAYIIRYKEGLLIRWSNFSDVKQYIKHALPFFGGNSMIVIKQQSAMVILGVFFSMKDVALYDLAVKIFTVPSVLVASINNALFPKVVVHEDISVIVKKIIKIENLIGICIFLLLVMFGKWIIYFMGGSIMLDAYPLLVILSFGIFAQLTVGAICNFVFIPRNENNYIVKNQFVAVVIFFLIAITGILLSLGVYVVPLALTLSVISELIYTHIIVKRNKMLN